MTAIAIFVKTPGLSAVKSRLAASVGVALAEDCHLHCARAVAAVALATGIGPVYWAVAEEAARRDPVWQDLPVLVQPQGGLGTRMQTIHDILIRQHGRAILLGADLPQVESSALQKAGQWLEGAADRGVIGPASDGGFWLIGANRSLPGTLWQSPSYGTGAVLEQMRAAIDRTLDWHCLATRTDLDSIEDLPGVMTELKTLACPHPDQHHLLDWLNVNLAKPHRIPTTQ